MTREDIIRMAQECWPSDRRMWAVDADLPRLERFAQLVAAAERKTMMQLFTDPENQPSQHGTVTLKYMQREIEAEREACAKLCEDKWATLDEADIFAEIIRARGDK